MNEVLDPPDYHTRFVKEVKCRWCPTWFATKKDTDRIPACESCQERRSEAEDEWNNAASWEDLLNLNQRYLRNEIFASSSYTMPPDRETMLITPGLLRLHDYGIITIESQPELDYTEQSPWLGGGWHRWVQKPWMMFLIPTEHDLVEKEKVRLLANKLLEDGKLTVSVWSECDTYRHPKKNKGYDETNVAPRRTPLGNDEPLRDAMFHFRTTTVRIHNDDKKDDQANCNVVTRYKHEDSRSDLTDSPWINKTSLPYRNIDALNEPGTSLGCDGKAGDALKNMRPLAFCVAAKEWDAGLDLQKIVEDACIEVGMKPAFARAE
ncbi:hypothetical protein BDV96DRAFT_603885 [Lophiotrema nucula]|uniref:DUF6919 domain-containing protein n=1 Tax=Lophiotrema nucula TaxID=690887 RepID=A0A6A5YU59_9PLEO|nr:hypothetical protein BDV96DRAFT_603885 [Lophiotrema nucula]